MIASRARSSARWVLQSVPGVAMRTKLIAERLALARTAPVPLAGSTALRRAADLPRLEDARVDRAWASARAEIAAFTLPDGTGGMNPGDRRAVYYLAALLRPSSVLEVGTHIGASTVHLCAAMREHSPSPNRRLLCVDVRDVNDPGSRPWREYGASHSPRETTARLGCAGFVQFVARPSLEVLREAGETFDLVVLDGDHSARAVYLEVAAALRLVAPGGVILLHDYFPDLRPLWRNGAVIPGPWLAMQRLRAEGLDALVHPLGALPWPTKDGSSITSLAVLLRA